MKRNRQNQGLTLIELVVVIVVAMAIGISALVFWQPHLPVNLQVQADRIASDIRYVQALAAAERKLYRFNYGGSTYYFTDSSGHNVYYKPLVTSDPVIKLGLDILFSGSGYVEFNSTEIPTAGTTIRIQSGGETKDIVVDQSTGRVFVP